MCTGPGGAWGRGCGPVCAVQLHHLVLQLPGLARRHLQALAVAAAVQLGVVLAQLRLQGEGAQQAQGDEGAGEAALHDVPPQLETQVVPAAHTDTQQV